MKKLGIVLGIIALGLVSTQAATHYSVSNSVLAAKETRNQSYVFDVATPEAADTYVLTNDWNSGVDSLSVVGALVITNNGILAVQSGLGNKEHFTMSQNTVLNGGLIQGNTKTWSDGPDDMGIDLGNNDLSLQSGTINAITAQGVNSTTWLRDGNLTGGGTIDVTGSGIVSFSNTVDTTGFDGSFNVKGSTLDLADISDNDASFGLTLSENGVYSNASNVALTSLTIDGTEMGNGTYGYSDFTADQQGYLADGGGTITLIPEPVTIGMLGLVALVTIFLRRKLAA